MEEKTARILVVDDDPHLRKSLADILGVKGYRVVTASDGSEAIAAIEKDDISVALIDLKLPDMDGLAVMGRLKRHAPLAEAIILTGHASLDSAIEATKQGAFSYLLKPYQMDTLLLDIQHAVERKQAQEEIRVLATTDMLTGINNRREFSGLLANEIARARRYGNALALIMYDIDFFKQVNDEFGHDAGDQVLRDMTDLVRRNTRTVDVLARWGGEEFMILMPQSDMAAAQKAAEKLRAAIAKHRFDGIRALTASFGVTVFHPKEEINSLLKRVDDALYQAKKRGRNRVEILS